MTWNVGAYKELFNSKLHRSYRFYELPNIIIYQDEYYICFGQYLKRHGITGVWMWLCISSYPAMGYGGTMYTLEFWGEAAVKNGLLVNRY